MTTIPPDQPENPAATPAGAAGETPGGGTTRYGETGDAGGEAGATAPSGTGAGASTRSGGGPAAASIFGALPGEARLPIPGNAEFALYLVALLLAALVCWIADDLGSASWLSFFQWTTIAYLLSRGIAKASRVLEQ